MRQIYIVYITCESKYQAEEISKGLLEGRLVACTNIWGPMTSNYWWQGELESSEEYVLFAKTSSKYLEEVNQKVKSLHSYDTPCVVSWEAGYCDAKYHQWLLAQLSPKD